MRKAPLPQAGSSRRMSCNSSCHASQNRTKITGQTADYLLKVVVKDLDEYQKLLLTQITKIQGVTGVHSSFVLNKVVDRSALPIA